MSVGKAMAEAARKMPYAGKKTMEAASRKGMKLKKGLKEGDIEKVQRWAKDSTDYKMPKSAAKGVSSMAKFLRDKQVAKEIAQKARKVPAGKKGQGISAMADNPSKLSKGEASQLLNKKVASAFHGFSKKALQDTRAKEDLAVAGTSMLPFGTTLHTLMSSGEDKGVEWLGRMAGAAAGGLLGALPGMAAKSPGLARAGATAGAVGGEVAASRLVHQGKYTPQGNLRPKYASAEDMEKEAYAAMLRKGMRTLGNVTGARQFASGMKQVGHGVRRGQVASKSPTQAVVKNTKRKTYEAANKNLTQGGAKLLGTGAVGTAGLAMAGRGGDK